MLEEQMGDQIISFIEDLGFRPYVQIPFFYGRIDFVGIKNDECMVIESKVKKWRDALSQVLRYGYGADSSYIALPSNTAKYVYNNHRDVFIKYGIGLIEVGYIANILIPSINNNYSHVYKKIILNEIKMREDKSSDRLNIFKEKYKL